MAGGILGPYFDHEEYADQSVEELLRRGELSEGDREHILEIIERQLLAHYIIPQNCTTVH